MSDWDYSNTFINGRQRNRSLDVLRRLGEKECYCRGVPTVKRGNYRLKDLKRKPVIASRVSCEIRSVGNKGPLSFGVLKSTWELQKPRSGVVKTTGNYPEEGVLASIGNVQFEISA